MTTATAIRTLRRLRRHCLYYYMSVLRVLLIIELPPCLAYFTHATPKRDYLLLIRRFDIDIDAISVFFSSIDDFFFII